MAISLLAFSDVAGELRATLDALPFALRVRASTDAFAGAGIAFDARLGALQALSSADVWWVGSTWRGECRCEAGVRGDWATEHDTGWGRAFVLFGTIPSAQLWESTSGGSSRADDFGWTLAGGCEFSARAVDSSGLALRVSARFVAGVWTNAAESKTALRIEWQLAVALKVTDALALVIGCDGLPAGGPRATPLDWRTLASVGRLYIGIETRLQ